jgi:methyl-accepting chemotaxis protein
LLTGSVLLAVVPLVVVVAVLAWSSIEESREALQQRAYEQMRSIREGKQEEIQAYFENVASTMALVAAGEDARRALRDMPAALQALPEQSGLDPAVVRESLKAYYADQFGAEYAKRNGGEAVDITANIDLLDEVARQAQFLYISGNPNPLGSKGDFDRAADPSAYSALHAAVHPLGREAVKRYGLYDFFLVDMQGQLVYSYFKELDFATNLANGPWTDSGLGRAFLAARDGTAAGEVRMIDYAPYLPSYNDQATFLSTPVVDNGQQIGVFIVQLPIDRVNAIMSYGGRWADVGLGQSGEVYLVGPDKTPRSNSRFMIEDRSGFLDLIRGFERDPERLASMQQRGTTVGSFTVDTSGVQEALAGRDGVGVYPDYRGVPILGAYAPLDVLGLRWALLSEIDEAEANQPVTDLARRIGLVAGVALLLVALSGVFFALRLARSINTPIARFLEAVKRFGGGDNSARVALPPSDEIGELGTAFDRMADERVATQQRIEAENDALNNSVVEIMTSVAELANRDLTVKVPVSEDVTGAVSDAINMMTRSTAGALTRVRGISSAVSTRSGNVRARAEQVRGVAAQASEQATSASQELQQTAMALRQMSEQAARASERAGQAIQVTGDALNIVRETVAGIANSRDQIRETEKRVKRLGERSQEIGSVVGIIGQIAERTSVLALNASMQAVAAGDAGRGFAVVADEVKRLAENARQATQQISSLVAAIQADTTETVQAMNQTISQVVDISRLADRAGGQMAETRQTTEQLVGAVQGIANAAQEQSRTSQTLLTRAYELLQASQRTLDELDAQREDTEALSQSAGELVETVGEFRLPG